MNLELSEIFISEKNNDLDISVIINCQEITIEDNERKELKKSITLTLKEFEKVLHIYNAFLSAQEEIIFFKSVNENINTTVCNLDDLIAHALNQ